MRLDAHKAELGRGIDAVHGVGIAVGVQPGLGVATENSALAVAFSMKKRSRMLTPPSMAPSNWLVRGLFGLVRVCPEDTQV